VVEQDSLIVIMHIPSISNTFFSHEPIEMQNFVSLMGLSHLISLRNLSSVHTVSAVVYNFSAKGQLPVCLTPSLFHRSI